MDSEDVQLLIRKLGSIEHILDSKLSRIEELLKEIEKRTFSTENHIIDIKYDIQTIKERQ